MKIRIKNKKRFGIVLSIVLVLTAMISGTYSLFYHENIAQSKEDYTTGILNIVAKSKSDNINLTNALPMTDEEGAQTEPYVFTIENTGNLDYNFNIRLLSTSANPINPDYIKLKIDDGEVTTLSSLTNSVIKDNITLKAKEVMDVSIRIWLASNTPNSEIGKSFNSKIVTEGQAVYTENNNKAYVNLVEHITSLYDDAEKTTVTYHNVEYNYATSVNLMNDRLGGTTESLDGGNIRYYDSTPKNFIDIGDRDSNNEPLLWRIIGVFDGKVRVVRFLLDTSLSWDTSVSDINDGEGINEWSQADLMKLLNPGYETNTDYAEDETTLITVNNSLWWNSESGNCYYRESTSSGHWKVVTCDFTNDGLSNTVKDKIVNQTIYLGGGDNGNIQADDAYRFERGDAVIQNPTDGVTRTTSWTGKVALPYSSDYGYSGNFNDCIGALQYYDFHLCREHNWLYIRGEYPWFINPGSIGFPASVWKIGGDGSAHVGGITYDGGEVYPVLTLSPELLIASDGDGSHDNPYVVK